MTFYVYQLIRPWNGVPCYVGKGSGARSAYHAKLGAEHYNAHLASIYRKAGDTPVPVVIVAAGLTEDEAFALEIKLIAEIGRQDQGKGRLRTGLTVARARRRYPTKRGSDAAKAYQLLGPTSGAKHFANGMQRWAIPKKRSRRCERVRRESLALTKRPAVAQHGRLKSELPHEHATHVDRFGRPC